MDITRRRSWMWAEACAMLEEAERKHRHFFDLLSAPSGARLGAAGRYFHRWLACACGGRAARRARRRGDGASLPRADCRSTPRWRRLPRTRVMNVVRLEIPYGRMRRRIELPPGRYALTERRLEHGCLHSAPDEGDSHEYRRRRLDHLAREKHGVVSGRGVARRDLRQGIARCGARGRAHATPRRPAAADRRRHRRSEARDAAPRRNHCLHRALHHRAGRHRIT